MEDICQNAMSALYLLLLHRSESSRQWPARAERNRNSLSDITLKNGVALAHFAVVCSLTGGEPRFLQEAGVEHHFGRLKAPCRGHPNLKDYLYGHRSLCSRQIRQLQSLSLRQGHPASRILLRPDSAESGDRQEAFASGIVERYRALFNSRHSSHRIPRPVSSMQTCESGGSVKDRTCFAAPRLQPA